MEVQAACVILAQAQLCPWPDLKPPGGNRRERCWDILSQPGEVGVCTVFAGRGRRSHFFLWYSAGVEQSLSKMFVLLGCLFLDFWLWRTGFLGAFWSVPVPGSGFPSTTLEVHEAKTQRLCPEPGDSGQNPEKHHYAHHYALPQLLRSLANLPASFHLFVLSKYPGCYLYLVGGIVKKKKKRQRERKHIYSIFPEQKCLFYIFFLNS